VDAIDWWRTRSAPDRRPTRRLPCPDHNGMGAMLFAVLAVAAQLDRNYIREKTLEG
jgi:hypothetical protein